MMIFAIGTNILQEEEQMVLCHRVALMLMELSKAFVDCSH